MDAQTPISVSIVDAIKRHARERPDNMAISFLADGGAPAASLTFAEVETRSRAIARELLSVAPDAERSMILQAPGLDFVLSLCGCFMAGVAAVPTPVPAARANSNAAQRFARLLADATPGVIVTHSDLLARSRWLAETQIGLSAQKWVLSDTCKSTGDHPEQSEIMPDDLALLQYTSGSTADPKGVLIDHANLAANLLAIQSKFELNEESVVVSWLPPYHDMGLIGGIISALWCGYHVVLMDPALFIKRPLIWLETIDRFRADVSGGANFAYDLCVDALARADKPAFDLSHWRLAFSGAEPVRASTIERFSGAFAQHGFRQETFYPCYGLAEATLMATGPDPDSPRPRIVETDDARKLVSCGTPCPGLRLEIVDPETGAPLAGGAEGEIRIAGTSVSRGYWGHGGGVGSDPLATGDLGFLQGGELFVTGRLKDLIIIRGRNIAPGDIEDATAICHPSLAPAASAAFSVDAANEEGFVVATEIRREHRRSTNWQEVFVAMRRRIVEQTGLMPTEMVLLRPGTLARTTSGKIRRQACREAYLGGDWVPLARSGDLPATDGNDEASASGRMAMASRDERWALIHDYLVWRLAQLTSIPEAFLQPDTALDTVGLDSLKQVEFALLVERDLDVPLSADWLDQTATLASFARDLQEMRKRPDEPEHEGMVITELAKDVRVPMAPRQADFFGGMPAHPEQFAEILYFRTPKSATAHTLQQAVRETVNLYDAFSLCFEHGKSGWIARAGVEHPFPAFKRVDISKMNKSEIAQTRSDVLRDILTGFALDKGVLISAVLMDRGEAQHGLLAVGFHHLVVDAVSLSAWAVRFQHVYTDIVEGRPTHAGLPEIGYTRWLRALEAYGRSPDLVGEFDYWRETCGVAGGSSSKLPSTETAAWRSTGKTTLMAEENHQLLELYQTPHSRHSAVLAALCRAWFEVTGDDAPLIMTESHGRHPFPGTDPSRAVGWFAARHPIGMRMQKGVEASEIVRDAEARLHSVPKRGHGYGLLRRRPKGDPLREEMDALRRPSVLLQYRGNVDDTFRKEAALPVIAVHHEARAYVESSRNLGDEQSLAVVAGLSDGVLYWSVFFDAPGLEETAREISDGMRRFFTELSSH